MLMLHVKRAAVGHTAQRSRRAAGIMAARFSLGVIRIHGA
jgi:hypothetical protein